MERRLETFPGTQRTERRKNENVSLRVYAVKNRMQIANGFLLL